MHWSAVYDAMHLVYIQWGRQLRLSGIKRWRKLKLPTADPDSPFAALNLLRAAIRPDQVFLARTDMDISLDRSSFETFICAGNE